MRVRRLRAVIENQVYVPRISGNVAKSTPLGVPELKDDHLRVDGIEDFLGLGRLRQHQLPHTRSQPAVYV